MNEERIQKVLSRLGHGSRREIERWIVEGSVKINGVVAQLGDKVKATDQLIVKGKRVDPSVAEKQRTRILLYYKPVGEVCSRQDPLFSKTVFANLPPIEGGRWVQVGRLDLNTAGLLIFTNDGELANQLMHPKYEIEREYAVRVCGQVTASMLQALRKGVMLEDGPGKFKKIDFQGGEGTNTWYHVVLTEGRHRSPWPITFCERYQSAAYFPRNVYRFGIRKEPPSAQHPSLTLQRSVLVVLQHLQPSTHYVTHYPPPKQPRWFLNRPLNQIVNQPWPNLA